MSHEVSAGGRVDGPRLGEKRAQNMVTGDNDGAKQAVLRSVDEIFNVSVLLGRYPILRILFTRLSSRFLSSFLAKPRQAEGAYKSRARVVALATSCREAGGRPCALRTRRA